MSTVSSLLEEINNLQQKGHVYLLLINFLEEHVHVDYKPEPLKVTTPAGVDVPEEIVQLVLDELESKLQLVDEQIEELKNVEIHNK